MSNPVITEPPAAEVERLVPFNEYAAARRHLLPSDESARWFLRVNKAALVEEGALLFLAGRWWADPSRCDEAIVRIGERRAREML